MENLSVKNFSVLLALVKEEMRASRGQADVDAVINRYSLEYLDFNYLGDPPLVYARLSADTLTVLAENGITTIGGLRKIKKLNTERVDSSTLKITERIKEIVEAEIKRSLIMVKLILKDFSLDQEDGTVETKDIERSPFALLAIAAKTAHTKIAKAYANRDKKNRDLQKKKQQELLGRVADLLAAQPPFETTLGKLLAEWEGEPQSSLPHRPPPQPSPRL